MVRLPRRGEVETRLVMEARVLPELAAALPVRAPVPVHVCARHGSTVYQRVPGRPIDHRALDTVGVDVIVDQLVELMGAVHGISHTRALELGVRPRELRPVLETFERRALPVVARAAAAELLDQAHALLMGYGSRFVHADLGPAHLLCDHTGVVGVIDWSDMAIGDPATDLAWVLNGLDRRLRELLLPRLDPALVARADLLHRLGPWWEILHGLDEHRPDLVRSGAAGARARLPA